MPTSRNPKIMQVTRVHAAGAAVGAAILIGSLVGIPACNRYMKSRQIVGIQAGAQADLRLIFEGENQFFKKNGFYTTDLEAIGIGTKKTMVLYKFGFVRPSVEGPKPEQKDLDALKAGAPQLVIEYSPVTKLDEIKFQNLGSYCVDCTATRTTFKAVAAANLDDDPTLDVWTIDEKGQITHVVDDLSEGQ